MAPFQGSYFFGILFGVCARCSMLHFVLLRARNLFWGFGILSVYAFTYPGLAVPAAPWADVWRPFRARIFSGFCSAYVRGAQCCTSCFSWLRLGPADSQCFRCMRLHTQGLQFLLHPGLTYGALSGLVFFRDSVRRMRAVLNVALRASKGQEFVLGIRNTFGVCVYIPRACSSCCTLG